jgi:hypothetical protein
MAEAAALAAAGAALITGEAAKIVTILGHCGFINNVERTAIASDGFAWSCMDPLSLTIKDTSFLAKRLGERTAAVGRINFGMRRTNLLKGASHWAHAFRRISRRPTLDGAADADAFRILTETARQRAAIRKHNAEAPDGLSKAADPGKWKRAKDWTAWSRGLMNCLSTMQGQDGVPLSYVVRENELPDYDEELEIDYDFEQVSVNCAPLTGPVFKTDARKVHQLIQGFLQGEVAETWTKAKEKKQNGGMDCQALRALYGGEGSKSVRVKEAEVLRTNLACRNERTMSFDKFLASMQSMFAGFEDNSEVTNDTQKIRLLFQKVQAPVLNQVKSALEFLLVAVRLFLLHDHGCL